MNIWHPCSQMKDYENFPPLVIEKAKGSYLFLKNGERILDAISSWWCKSFGHAHPRLTQALIAQAKKFEHVILANTTNDVIVKLSSELTSLTQTLKKVFYASEGSSAVEIALKMSLHSRQITGQPQKNKILALQNGYHGETLLALAVSDQGIYRDPYRSVLPDVRFIQQLPYVYSREDESWQDISKFWMNIEEQLHEYAESVTAIIVEPVIQGAGGMRIYSPQFLVKLRRWCDQHDVHLIADEIMTGMGRTGKMFAYEYANIEPDFLCIGKGLTAGYLPMSAVLLTDEIYAIFYDDYEKGKSFLHSHTFSGNALAAAVAVECLQLFKEQHILNVINALETKLFKLMKEVAEETGKITNVRCLGAVVAADLINDASKPRAGYGVYREAVRLGALLRPLGNTLYWLPPFNIDDDDLTRLSDITRRAIEITLGK